MSVPSEREAQGRLASRASLRHSEERVLPCAALPRAPETWVKPGLWVVFCQEQLARKTDLRIFCQGQRVAMDDEGSYQAWLKFNVKS